MRIWIASIEMYAILPEKYVSEGTDENEKLDNNTYDQVW